MKQLRKVSILGITAALMSVALAAPLSASTTPAETPVTEARDQRVAAEPEVDRGLEFLVSDYETRVPTKYTADSWAPFAEALTTASDVADDTSATTSEVAEAKTALMTAAADLEAADEGTFQTITNNTFWNDTSGNPIYSQGGGVFKFGDTYYWYGVHYTGAESYRANPTRKYDNQVSFVSIPVYSSKDLVNWKFENRIATRSTDVGSGATLGGAGWVGRLGVTYNENTGKYVLAVQMWHTGRGGHGVLLLQGDSPTDTLDYGYFQTQITNSPTTGTGDQTVFTDDDGKDYLIFSNREGRSRGFVAKFRESDSLRIEPGVEIRRGAGREGNAMFKLDGRYYHAASDLHGWNTSVNYVNESTSGNVQGSYSSEYVLAGTEMDYSHVTQTGFFVTVNGTKQSTVIYAGDRWADFAWNGIGYNQWLPITKAAGARPQFHSVSQWQVNVTTGEWRAGPANNYILNPDIQADRIIVSSVRGWRNLGGSVTNVDGGANGSRFALQISNSGGVEQRIASVPAGTYTLALHARGNAGQVVITGANGGQRTLGIPSSGGWAKRELTGIELPGGTATVTVRASGSGGVVVVDQLSLVKTSDNNPPQGQRHEAESAPAVCQGTIDSNYSGFSGSGFCNGVNAAGSYTQFTVTRQAAGTTALGIRFANGSTSARSANIVVNGATVGTVSFEPTGAWSAWATKPVTVSLNAGSNTVRLDPTSTAGLANIDYLDIRSDA